MTELDGACLACDRIQKIQRIENPCFIAELSESFAVLSDEQAYPGWCVLLLKDHHEHLAALPTQRQRDLWNDVANVAAAITRALNPVRINYECLGNQLHHIHWHIIPRYANDPAPSQPIWLRSPEERRGTLDPAAQNALIAQIREAIRTSVG